MEPHADRIALLSRVCHPGWFNNENPAGLRVLGAFFSGLAGTRSETQDGWRLRRQSSIVSPGIHFFVATVRSAGISGKSCEEGAKKKERSDEEGITK